MQQLYGHISYFPQQNGTDIENSQQTFIHVIEHLLVLRQQSHEGFDVLLKTFGAVDHLRKNVENDDCVFV